MLSSAMKVCMKRPLSGQCLCPAKKYFLFPAIFSSTHYRLYSLTKQTGINHFYSSIWIQQTALYGQGTVSFGSLVSCGVGFQQNVGQKSVTDPRCRPRFFPVVQKDEPCLNFRGK
jgi:hypothetical protein